MSYGLKYQSTFDPLKDNAVSPVYTVKIYQKGYTGSTSSFLLSGTPLRHSWDTDDPKAPVKGSSLTVGIVNQGAMPITVFYSVEDDTFLVELYHLNDKIFAGFLVQDDCSEPLVDTNHEITISANDNLGLLKEVKFDQAPYNYTKVSSWPSESFRSDAPHSFTVSAGLAAAVSVGQRIEIIGTFGGVVDGIFNITAISGTTITVAETVPTYPTSGLWNVAINVYASNLYDKKTLLEVIKSCLAVTNLELETYIYSNLFEVTHVTTESFLSQTLIAPSAFMSDEKEFEDCYTVLERICQRFNLTLFQSKGRWNFIRWDELNYYNNAVPGYIYDADFTLLGTTVLDEVFTAGINELTVAESAPLRRIFRPFKYKKETFNYKQPARLLRNFDLTEVGALLSDYVTGTGSTYRRYREYRAMWWRDAFSADTVIFIRVITDFYENELERYLVIKRPSGAATANLTAYPIEVNEGDSFEFSYDYRTNSSTPLPFQKSTTFILYDGSTTLYYGVGGASLTQYTWSTIPQNAHSDATSDVQDWNSASHDTIDHLIPNDGLLTIHIPQVGGATPQETHIKDIRFTYHTFINQSTKIVGHVHTQTQTPNTKNKEEEEIYMDASPKNSISGSLFLNTMTGVLQTRVGQWKRGHLTEAKRLGELMTKETMNWRQVSRANLDGTFKELVQGGKHFSMLSIMRYTYSDFVLKSLLAGRMEIDYKNNSASVTWHENHAENESEVTSDYVFNYKYEAT